MYVQYNRHAYILRSCRYNKDYAVYGNLLVDSFYILSEDMVQLFLCVPLFLNTSKPRLLSRNLLLSFKRSCLPKLVKITVSVRNLLGQKLARLEALTLQYKVG